MKWFKHMSDMSHDPKIQNVEKWYGLEGYARWLKILEIIASDMNESDRCEVTLDERIWKDRLGFYRLKEMHIYLQSIANLGLIHLQSTSNPSSMSGQCITILCPNLLKIRARKKPIGSKTRPLEVEVEVDKDIHTYVKPVKPAKAGAPSEPSFVSKIQKYFLEKWEEKYQMKYQAFSWAQTGALLKRLEKDFSAAPGKLNDAIDKFMHSDDVFILESRHNFGVFYKTINRWLTEKAVAETPMQKVFREMKEERERKKNDVR